MAFEIVDMTLDERSKYRRLLADNRLTTPIVSDSGSPAAAVHPPAEVLAPR
jgi:hypothetical protein